MIKKNQEFYNRLNQILDILLVVICYLFSSWIWLAVKQQDSVNMANINGEMLLASFIYAVTLSLLFVLIGFYETTRTRKLKWKIKIILLGTTTTFLVSSFFLYLLRLQEFSRGVFLIFYGTTVVTLCLKYFIMRKIMNRLRALGYNIKHEVVVGTGALAMQYTADIRNEQTLGINIQGYVGEKKNGLKGYFGGYDQLDRILSNPDIDEVVIALEPEEFSRIWDVVGMCEKNGVKYYIIPFYNDIIPPNPIIENVGNSKLINMRANRLENVGWATIKRVFDFFASGLGLIVLSPLLMLIALGVKLSSPGPVLFKQVRVGYRRQEFKMLKFRSMKVNSEETTAWTKDADDRRTPFGSMLRKLSLDELPQLWNVFVGDMSLVGPRPELPFFVDQFRETIPFYMVKHQVKPGITGWAQINGLRGDTNIEKRVEYDLWYIDNWSVWLDIRIMLKTVFGGMLNHETLGGKKQSSVSSEKKA
ncbi:MAG: undecaprenyl-phosphate glucose phosphotransferase [Clostridia bacterium]|nr:undecaprenyl-phosphate glucose phosphotransferase [Clostridia bacterium]